MSNVEVAVRQHRVMATEALYDHRDGDYMRAAEFLRSLVDGNMDWEKNWKKMNDETGGMLTSLSFKEECFYDNGVLRDVIPFLIMEYGENDEGVLIMQCFSEDGIVRINMNTLRGIDVVRGDNDKHEFEENGELLVEFTYINPKTNKPEDKKRRLRVLDLFYGVDGKMQTDGSMPIHRMLGEKPDFYLMGQDTQYDCTTPKTSYGSRQFPLWRILGFYGSVDEVLERWLGSEGDVSK